MNRLLIGATLAAALVAAPRTAAAQVQAPEKGFFRPLVGATVGAGPGGLFGATFGIKAGPKVQITGEIGRMTNILPKSVNDQVDVAAAVAANALGGKHSSNATAEATYGSVGFRYAMREVSGAQTFLEFGVGAARVDSAVSAVIRGSETLQGDISNLVTTPFTAGTPATKPLVSIGGGIILGVTRTLAVEAGYRYARVFTKSPAINMSKIVGGVRFGF